jgi:tubulin-specific chaperone D
MDSSHDATADEEKMMTSEATGIGESFLFVEVQETFRCIQGLRTTSNDPASSETTNNGEGDAEACLNRLREIWDKYLECPTLLDPFLEKMVQELTSQVQDTLLLLLPYNAVDDDHAANDVPAAVNDTSTRTSLIVETTIQFPLTALYALSKVRGYKYIQRFLPHGVDQLEPIWKTLQLCRGEKDEARASSWESIYMVWHWMSVLSLIPFDCKVFTVTTPDSSNGPSNNRDDDAAALPFMEALMTMAQEEFQKAGPVREAAATCLAAWLSRPDWEETQLPAFIQWAQTVLKEYITTTSSSKNSPTTSNSSSFGSSTNLFRVMGALQTCTAILKGSSAARLHLITHMQALWDPLARLADWQQQQGVGGGISNSNLLLRKLLVKFWTRMGCAYLPPRIAAWRYQRGKRSLDENLRRCSSKPRQSSFTSIAAGAGIYDHNDHHDDLFHVPDLVEDAMGRVLESLCHSSTIVRWSAAKGIGRMTERLPSLCAEDVLDALLECFDCVEKDQSWHGACLALAELARRGLLLPRRLGDVVPLIILAIQYDLQRGQSSVGAHVRDAACYTYWAFARAYNPSLLQPFLKELSEAIVLVSLFDREVNCRRAASAAFQEVCQKCIYMSSVFATFHVLLIVPFYFASIGGWPSACSVISKWNRYPDKGRLLFPGKSHGRIFAHCKEYCSF